MRRSEMPRRTRELPRTALRRGKGNPIPAASRRVVQERSQGACEGRFPHDCTGRGEHMHHIVRRRDGGHDPSNLAHLCQPAHADVHSHPAAARAAGLIRSAVPTLQGDDPMTAPTPCGDCNGTGKRPVLEDWADVDTDCLACDGIPMLCAACDEMAAPPVCNPDDVWWRGEHATVYCSTECLEDAS